MVAEKAWILLIAGPFAFLHGVRALIRRGKV
jgi:hypothetical protein